MQNQNSTKNGASQAVITRDSNGRARRIQANGHIVELHRLDHSDLILISCYTGDGQTCEVNSRGICAHALEGLFTAGRDAGVCLTTCVHKEVAESLALQVGGRILCARSDQTPNGEGCLWVVAGSNGKPAKEETYHDRAGAIIGDMLSGEISPALAEIRLAAAAGAEEARHRAEQWEKFQTAWEGLWS